MALSADKIRVYGPHDPDFEEFPVLASTTIYKGSLVALVEASGYARPADGDETAELFVGIAEEQVVNSGSSGDKMVKVRTRGVLKHVPVAGGTIDDVRKTVYLSDDDTLTLTGTTTASGTSVGKVRRFRTASDMDVEFGAQFQLGATADAT